MPTYDELEKKDGFHLFKSIIGRIFAYVILLYISINTYQLYQATKTSYEEFLFRMEEPLITDIKFVNNSDSCPDGYNEIINATIPSPVDGCACDGIVVRGSQCQLFHIHTSTPCKAEHYYLDPNNNISYSPLECNTCFTNFTNMKSEPLNIEYFYPKLKPCLYPDENQTTQTYIASIATHCDKENICNEFFCKLNNDKNNKCPITFAKQRDWVREEYVYDLTEEEKIAPIFSATNYDNWGDYDSNYHGIVGLPLTDILIGRNGVCARKTYFTTKHPLLPNSNCGPDNSFYPISRANFSDLLKYNNHYDTLNEKLPYLSQYTEGEYWTLYSQTSFAFDTIYCLVDKYDLNTEDQFTNREDLNTPFEYHHKEEKREHLYELLSSFATIFEDTNFVGRIQMHLLITYIIITSIEIIYVFFRLLNICGDCIKCYVYTCSFEAYFTLFIDFFILITATVAKIILGKILHRIEELIETHCLDSYTHGMMTAFKVVVDVCADKNLEMILIILSKLAIIVISILFYVFIKRSKIKCKECELIVFDKNVFDDHSEKKNKKPDNHPNDHAKDNENAPMKNPNIEITEK
jgi:hypothetical protein